jgi:hypothetical protein
VLSFLKRRRILLSCAVMLLACSMVTFGFRVWTSKSSAPFLHHFGLEDGVLYWYRRALLTHSWAEEYKRWANSQPDWSIVRANVHAPLLGREPALGLASLNIPLWLLLSVVLGWIVFLELRWREKRARKAEQP